MSNLSNIDKFLLDNARMLPEGPSFLKRLESNGEKYITGDSRLRSESFGSSMEDSSFSSLMSAVTMPDSYEHPSGLSFSQYRDLFFKSKGASEETGSRCMGLSLGNLLSERFGTKGKKM